MECDRNYLLPGFREMENISRGPIFGDLHREVDAGRHRCKTSLSPPSFKCNVLRESLSEDSQNTPCGTLKKRGSWVISFDGEQDPDPH